MKKINSTLLISLTLVTFISCSDINESVEVKLDSTIEKIDYSTLPFKNENGNITAVIEIPAGTNHKYEYNYDSKEFECEMINGEQRVVKFMPYVANYGFIPGTYMDKERGGDGDALDVLVLSEATPQGEIIEIEPVATLMLLDHGEEDHKIIAVPVIESQKLIQTDTLSSAVKTIIQTWFTNYKGAGKMEFLTWRGKDSTIQEINKWVK